VVARTLSEVEELKRNAKLVAQLAKQFPGLDVDQARVALERIEVEVQRWIKERQSAQELLRGVLTRHDEMWLDVRAVAGLCQLTCQKALEMAGKTNQMLAELEALKIELRELSAEVHKLVGREGGTT
jgi:hypothetical protein